MWQLKFYFLISFAVQTECRRTSSFGSSLTHSGHSHLAKRRIWTGANSYKGAHLLKDSRNRKSQSPKVSKTYEHYTRPKTKPQKQVDIPSMIHNKARKNDAKYVQGLKELSDLI